MALGESPPEAGTQTLDGPSFSVTDGAGTLTGRKLGDFVVLERIGAGGFGVVYRAEQPALGRDAVIKVLHTQLAAQTNATQRFLREARLASRLDHPYAAHIYAFGAEDDGTLWLAMERVRGTPLSELLKAGALTVKEFAPLFNAICEVVHTAHDQGIIHRDLKPGNVMVLSRAGRLLPKLLDFGIAKLNDAAVAEAEVRTDVAELSRLLEDPSLAFPDVVTAEPTHSMAFGVTMAREVTPRGALELGENLTSASDKFLGSPAFCAPEQWVNPAAADRRTDVYALGVLAYHSLTGRLPFSGRTMDQVARAHAKQPLPPLGDGFPAGLDKVLARACAKRPADRYADALELAADFLAAAGVSEDVPAFTRLEPRLLRELETEAPRPVAEAATRLEAATSPRASWEALRALTSTICRYLGVLALASRTQVSGSGGSAEAPALQALLQRLWEDGLADSEWLELGVGLLSAFGSQPEAHPLPALVRFLHSETDAAGGTRQLAALAARLGSPLAQGEEEAVVRDELQKVVLGLEPVLRRLSALFEYELVVAREDTTATGGEAERWMGVRRAVLPRVQLRGRPLQARRPALVDATGTPLLTLYPFLQVAEPSPGAAEELFVFERSGRFGARLLALPTELERQDETLAKVYRQRFLSHLATQEARDEQEHAPYRGLAAFGVADAGSFFGREREAESFLNRLQSTPLLAVVGASGAGKSSFVQAGVLPLLPPGWQTIVVRPGRSPLAALAARLAEDGYRTQNLAFALAASPDALRQRLEDRLTELGPTAKLLLVVDQFEETLTLCPNVEERNTYALALTRAARSSLSRIRVVLTLRDDFLMRVQQLPGVSERMSTALQLLATPSPEDLLRIVTEPARRLGYQFEPADLPARMVAAVKDQPGALALLSFTALKLWELRDRHFRLLSDRAYQALGGVGGALAQHAEAMLDRMADPVKLLVREAFRHLVTGEGTRAVLTRRELRQVLGDDANADNAVEQLIAARLLVSTEGAGEGLDRVEVTHEALLSAWPRLVKWRHEDAEGVRLRDELRAAARAWEAKGQPRELLWRGELLTEYRLWRARYQGHLTSGESQFVERSAGADRLRRRVIQSLLSTAFVVLSVGLAVVLWMNSKAEARWLALLEEQGRQATLAGDPLRALAFLSEAHRHGASDRALQFLLARNRSALDGVERVFRDRQPLYGVDLSPDGELVAVAGESGEVTVFRRRTGETVRRFPSDGHAISSVAFLGDGRVLAVRKGSSALEVWSLQGSETPFLLQGHSGRVSSAAVSPDRRWIASGGLDDTVRLWDGRDLRLVKTLTGHTGTVNRVAFSANGRRLISASDDHTARVWDRESGDLLAVLRGHTDVVWTAVLSADGSVAVTGSNDHSVKTWDVDTAILRVTYTQHTRNISTVAVTGDGKLFLSISEDGAARLVSTQDGETRVNVVGSAPLWFALFSPDEKTFLTCSADAQLRSYDTQSGALRWTYRGHTDAVGAAVFSPDSKFFVSSGFDATARVWDASYLPAKFSVSSLTHEPLSMGSFTPDGKRAYFASKQQLLSLELPSGLPGPKLTFFGKTDQTPLVATSPDGQTLAVGDGRQLQLRAVSDFSVLRTLSGHTDTVTDGAFSPDGAWLATTSLDRTARLWDARTGQPGPVLPHDGVVWYATFSPDGKLLVTASQDAKARLWDAHSGRLLRVLSGHVRAVNAARFSPDGAQVVTASDDRTAKIWDVASGAVLATLDEHTAEIYDVAYSTDGALVFTSGNDTRAMAWDAQSGKLLGPVAWHHTSIPSVRVGPGGLLLTASEDGVGAVWDVSSNEAQAAQIAADSHCYVPFVFRGDHLLHTPVDRSGCPELP